MRRSYYLLHNGDNGKRQQFSEVEDFTFCDDRFLMFATLLKFEFLFTTGKQKELACLDQVFVCL